MRKSLSKEERLKRTADFRRVFQSPSRVSCLGAKLAFASNPEGKLRLGLSLTKKFGNAVTRNKAKRQLRELFRTNKETIASGYDLLFILFPGDFSYADRKKQFFTLLQRAELQNGSG